MPHFLGRSLFVAGLFALCAGALLSAEKGETPTIGQKTAGMEHKGGYFPLDWDARAGKLYLEISRPGASRSG